MGDGRFAEAAAPYGLDSLRDARGLAVSDFDGDGDLDFILNNYNAPTQYFVNRAASGHWLRERESNRDGIGAIVRVRAGSLRQMRVITAGDGYASQYSRLAHFGLGGNSIIDEFQIAWPSGKQQSFRLVPAGRIIDDR